MQTLMEFIEENFQDLNKQDINKIENDSWVLIYGDSEILLEKWDNLSKEAKKLPSNKVREMRIFNESYEVRIWRYQGEIMSRYFNENNSIQYEQYAQSMLLWGNTVENENTLVESGYGARIKFPMNIKDYTLPLKIETISYYTWDENGLIHFQDARLVKITDNKGQEVKK